MLPEFKNEPLTDFSKPENKSAFEQALAKVRSQLGAEYPLIIGGERVTTRDKFDSINPSDGATVVGRFQKATRELTVKAVENAATTFESWKKTPPQRRAQYLFDAAKKMRERKHEFSAWMVFEVGKSWAEADADTAEAIDFMEYYGREMLRLAQGGPVTKIPTEHNKLEYIPLGVGAVVPPWNFPLAICVGMATAAIVCGNTVVLKPSSDSPTIAAQFVALMNEVGLPAGVLNFITGAGAEVGDTLVAHPKIRFISFTGSKEVGLRINELAAKPQQGQLWIKRVVAEMGGKDSIVVAEDADLDAAADGIVASAFGFQGQKCSACSRAIVVDKVYEAVLQKVVERTRKIGVGDVTDPRYQMGPVVNARAQQKILEYIQKGLSEGGKLVTGGNARGGKGFFIEPTVIADVAPTATIAQEEIFGPVLAFIRAKDFDHALHIANNTEYGLTGSVYSRDRKKLERASNEFHVGNLYLNRKCTGALVGVHPFGGFNMSGTDSKAGGPDYLLLFLQAKAISEKIS
jgi:1-pyrroline-5-carboxylate dehydrogenase